MQPDLIKQLNNRFGYPAFRPGQLEAIRNLLSGKHTLVVMPTGAGKSLIYQFLSFQLPGITLVISPLIALMKDQVDALSKRNMNATFINSALPANEQAKRLKNLRQGQYRLVYVAPERLRSVAFLEALKNQTISLLAVDEAHCISEWGHDFRPDYLNIARARVAFQIPLTVALTATATTAVQKDIIRLLGLGDSSCCIVTGFNRPNLSLNVAYTNGIEDKLRVLKDVLGQRTAGAIIVYTGTRRDAEEVADFTQQALKIPAKHYHAGLSSEERTDIQNDFVTGRLNVIAATNAFGMGIDRADVRQVIHYSMPGSLEAYYQEAGRAGRDGLAARATLFYDPQDRALHEFFIQQSELRISDLSDIYAALQNGQSWVSEEDLSRVTGQHPIRIRVGLSALERSGAIEHLGDEGFRWMYRKGEWIPGEIEKTLQIEKRHQDHRQKQLDDMATYAETNDCRRRIILHHFGDVGEVKADDCCDNCSAKKASPGISQGNGRLSSEERAVLVILDCIRRLKNKIGRRKLVKILSGSQARDILEFHYDRNIYYGRFIGVRQKEIEAMLGQLVKKGYIKTIGGRLPVLTLTPKGETAVQTKEKIGLELPAAGNSSMRNKKKPGSTLEFTAELFARGMNSEQIASERNLAISTINYHLSQLIESGIIAIEQVVRDDIREKVEDAVREIGSDKRLSAIKAILPEEISYDEIHFVVAALRYHSNTTDINSSDIVENFLSKSHPRELKGSWQHGWSLGFHSAFSGSSWARSDIGEMAYRLKYNGDTTVMKGLVAEIIELLHAYPELKRADYIVPVPPSEKRSNDHVQILCEAVGKRIMIPVKTFLKKSRQTKPQKEMKTLAQKKSNVQRAFSLPANIKGDRILLVDDLFDSGATLEEATQLLYRRGAEEINVLTLTRTIHSDA